MSTPYNSNIKPDSKPGKKQAEMAFLSIWWLAIRPKTLSISVTPVLLGSALAWYDYQHISLITLCSILLSALCIQIGTNLYNDAADFEKGADTSERLGPRRAAQQGWLTAQQIKAGALVSFSIAFIVGVYLAMLGGVPIIILGLVSILCGYAYTSGPKPIAYSPFGELFVLIFFGFAAVGGTYYLQTQSLTPMVLIFASTIGSMAAAILLVNNYRDLDGDRKAHKLTLIHYTHRPLARIIFALMLLYPYIILWPFISELSWQALLPIITFPLALKLIHNMYHLPISSQLNQVLAQTAQLQLFYTLVLSLILVL